MTQLLVSVRSAVEAEIALEGGAALIDVKEPSSGPLGMASVTVIADVIRAVSGRVPVSAALGEARDSVGFLPEVITSKLAYVKYGTAGCEETERVRYERAFDFASGRLQAVNSSCQVVLAAYADWQRARAPSPSELCRIACEHRAGAFLLDTWGKDGSTLLDWLSLADLEKLCHRCRVAHIPVALAGSLGTRQIHEVAALRPDWIAVRGAACQSSRREGTIDLGKVRGLVNLIDDLKAATPAD